jgi:NAD(P)H dehydrogenase (quinone)
MSETNQPTLLVTGASGHLGRRVVELLLEQKAGNIVAATRTPEKLANFSAQGVIVRQADFDDPASLAEAFKGVDRLLLISTDVMGSPDRRINQHRNAVKAAEAAGVQHVVYTSIQNPTPEWPAIVNPDHFATENALAESKLGWTVLRENLYTENLIGTLTQAIPSGSIFAAAGDSKAAYITREDCARAAAAALTSDFSGQRTLDITGPEALSQADIAAIGSQISGKSITYVAIDQESLIQGMIGAGLPRPMAEGYATFDAGIAQGQFSEVSDTVETLTGRKPISVLDFLTANRDTLPQGAGAD